MTDDTTESDDSHRLDNAEPTNQPEDAPRDENGDPEFGDAKPPETRQRNINESAHTVRLETQVKRGEGTRDEDRIKIKVRGDDPKSAAQKLHDTVVAVGDNNTVNALRGTQPGNYGDGDE